MGRRNGNSPTDTSITPRLPGTGPVLAALDPILLPLIRVLLVQGIDYVQFSNHLKPLFLAQAQAELERQGQKQTNSALSVLSGVHRKDVKAWREQGSATLKSSAPSLPSQIFAAWHDEPALCNRSGNPRPLPRTGPAPSFDTLVRSLTSDVHPYTVLNDLLRLGMVRLDLIDGVECVQLESDAFTPPAGSQELLDLFSGNLADHCATAVANLLAEQPPLLEQSVFADGLSLESLQRLEALSRTLWEQAQAQFITMARRLYEQDKSGNHEHRLRFGAYFHCTPHPEEDN